ncbi:hypothetical protein CALCODRAFT_511840 [Calocera cornea HHB12733]|uniref:Uncharacterized protein n=1 Tax=Calocera cornea HHB12733 TaxID=1353952 RepID=A0A165DHJ0_9BASI|nr:hypothetical protein CALCODRAFT_511840 [Calocera cornea HHB12733]
MPKPIDPAAYVILSTLRPIQHIEEKPDEDQVIDIMDVKWWPYWMLLHGAVWDGSRTICYHFRPATVERHRVMENGKWVVRKRYSCCYAGSPQAYVQCSYWEWHWRRSLRVYARLALALPEREVIYFLPGERPFWDLGWTIRVKDGSCHPARTDIAHKKFLLWLESQPPARPRNPILPNPANDPNPPPADEDQPEEQPHILDAAPARGIFDPEERQATRTSPLAVPPVSPGRRTARRAPRSHPPLPPRNLQPDRPTAGSSTAGPAPADPFGTPSQPSHAASPAVSLPATQTHRYPLRSRSRLNSGNQLQTATDASPPPVESPTPVHVQTSKHSSPPAVNSPKPSNTSTKRPSPLTVHLPKPSLPSQASSSQPANPPRAEHPAPLRRPTFPPLRFIRPPQPVHPTPPQPQLGTLLHSDVDDSDWQSETIERQMINLNKWFREPLGQSYALSFLRELLEDSRVMGKAAEECLKLMGDLGSPNHPGIPLRPTELAPTKAERMDALLDYISTVEDDGYLEQDAVLVKLRYVRDLLALPTLHQKYPQLDWKKLRSFAEKQHDLVFHGLNEDIVAPHMKAETQAALRESLFVAPVLIPKKLPRAPANLTLHQWNSAGKQVQHNPNAFEDE